MGLVKVPERENCHPQDLSFLSVIPRVSNFIHPVTRFSLASGNRLRGSGYGSGLSTSPSGISIKLMRILPPACEITYRQIHEDAKKAEEANESDAWSLGDYRMRLDYQGYL